MDLNPDQIIALGKFSERSLAVRAFNVLNRMIFQRAADIIVLDRFMAERVLRKSDVRHKLHIMPPWPLEGHLETIAHDENPFRRQHHLNGKFVFMYSGNHSPSHPLDTILQAAERLRARTDIVFMFVGGGLAKRDVEAAIASGQAHNIVSLPYQPVEDIKYSLSAADAHLVVMGNAMVGCVHPCKVYGAMALGRPVVVVGPDESHLADLIALHDNGWRITHGDIEGAAAVLEQIAARRQEELQAIGARGLRAIEAELSKSILANKFCDVIERGLQRPT